MGPTPHVVEEAAAHSSHGKVCDACRWDRCHDGDPMIPRPEPENPAHRGADRGGRIITELKWTLPCGKRLEECGGTCVLAAGHETPCECCGDDVGEPGTCPA